jgi:hypothetical protein
MNKINICSSRICLGFNLSVPSVVDEGLFPEIRYIYSALITVFRVDMYDL